MPIYLIRHGETTLNATRILQPPDTPLSEEGLAQAEALGRRLKGQHVDAILSSDLSRTLQTSQAIVAQPVVCYMSAILGTCAASHTK
jgi:2,3-bisphosphoglycerate-dependent phosphoglycerate mutase